MNKGIITTDGTGRRVVLADKKNEERANKLSKSEIALEVATAMDSMRAVDHIVDSLPRMKAVDSESAHTLLSAYADVRNAAADMVAYRDRIKSVVKSWLEAHPDVKEIEDRITLTRFTLSAPSEEVSYDEQDIKSERPDVWKRVAKRFGKRMTKKERTEIERQVSDLKSQIAALNARLVEDDAARTEHFDPALFDSMIDADPSLAKYRHVSEKPRRFYYKESDDAKDFAD